MYGFCQGNPLTVIFLKSIFYCVTSYKRSCQKVQKILKVKGSRLLRRYQHYIK